MATEMILTVEEAKDRDKWLAVRRTGIGGSDAGTIVGVNKWNSIFSVWLDKTGQANEETKTLRESAEERMYWGNIFEPAIADRFCEITGKKAHKQGTVRSLEHPCMIANVDRVIVGENAILECKTTSARNKKDWEDEEIPASYYCQIQHYMAVGGWDRCYIACLIDYVLVWKVVERNEEDIQALIKLEENFWNTYVVPKVMPPADGTERCAEAITKHFAGGITDAKNLTDDYDTLCREYVEVCEQIKALEAIKLEKSNAIRMAMGDAEYGTTAKYNIWYKSGYRTESFNRKQFEKDYPKLYEQYKKTTFGRRFYVKESKARKGDN